MSEISEIAAQFLPEVSSLVTTLQPHVVVTAPDGSQLWIAIAIPTSGGQSSLSDLFAGFKVSLALQALPTTGNVTILLSSSRPRKGGGSWLAGWRFRVRPARRRVKMMRRKR